MISSFSELLLRIGIGNSRSDWLEKFLPARYSQRISHFARLESAPRPGDFTVDPYENTRSIRWELGGQIDSPFVE